VVAAKRIRNRIQPVRFIDIRILYDTFGALDGAVKARARWLRVGCRGCLDSGCRDE
jgi:hypothetical protein